jgi:hypothetical protein
MARSEPVRGAAAAGQLGKSGDRREPFRTPEHDFGMVRDATGVV